MSKKLFVGSLDWNATDEDLQKAFEPFGEVTEAKVVRDRDTGRSRGFGFVTMTDGAAAQTAMEKLDNSELRGRTIRVSEARERPQNDRGGDGGFGRRGGGGGGGRDRDRRNNGPRRR